MTDSDPHAGDGALGAAIDPMRLYAALLGDQLSTAVLLRHWIRGEPGRAFVASTLSVLPQPGSGAGLADLDANRHGPDGPVRAQWPPVLRAAGTARYVAMVALALHEHGTWRSSLGVSELAPLAEALRYAAPASWSGAFEAVVLAARRATPGA